MNILDKIIAEIKSWFKHDATAQEKAAYLDNKASTTGAYHDWRTSVVDLLKLMGQDSSMDARAQLFRVLGDQSHYTGSTEQNKWLHGRLMYELKIR